MAITAQPLSTSGSTRRRFRIVEALSLVAALAAALAPASLTGSAPIDAVHRAVIAGAVTYVGSHGRRRGWLLGGGLLAIAASGASMVLVLAGLGVAFASTFRSRRSRRYGAAAIGLLVNAIFWYPTDAPWWTPLLALVVCGGWLISGYPNLRRSSRRVLGVAIGVAMLGAVVVAALAGFAVARAATSVRDGGDAAQEALDAARAGDGEAASTQLVAATTAFDQAADALNGPLTVGAQAVPGLAQQLDAVQTTVEQGRLITDVGDDLVATADYDALQTEGQIDLDRVASLAEPTQRADDVLAGAEAELTRVQQPALLPPLRDRIEDFADQIGEAGSAAHLARSLVDVAPALLGGDGDRRYLVIFLTPAELRGAGGFIGSYAELHAVDGRFELVRSGRIDDLIDAAPQGSRTISGPEDYLLRYGPFRPQDYLQDVTLSPHFPSSASVIAQLYPQSGGLDVDGVIGVDPAGLAALLQLTGPVAVDGLDAPLDATNAEDLLLRRQYLELGTRAERGEFLAEATRATFDQLVDADLPAPQALADALSPATRGGHLRLWSPTDDEQAVFELLGADGSLHIPDGADGFSVTQRNAGNNKIDAYLHRTIAYDTTVDARTGAVRSTLRIEVTNGLPTDVELPSAVADNTRAAPKGTSVAVLTVHTPLRVTEATIDDVPTLLGPGEERGLYAWDTPTLEIAAGATTVIEITMEGHLDLSEGYDLRILPQPVANPDEATASLHVEGGSIEGSDATDLVVVPRRALTEPIDETISLER